MPSRSSKKSPSKPEVYRFRKQDDLKESLPPDATTFEEEGVLLAYYRRRLNEVRVQLSKMEKGTHKKAIHRFRVAVKKLRAEKALVEYILEKKTVVDKNMKGIKKIYDASGRERDLQLQLSMLPVYGRRIGLIFPELYQQLRKQEELAAAELKQVVHSQSPHISGLPSAKYQKELSESGGEDFVAYTRYFIDDQLSMIAFESRRAAGADSLHEIRKSLKKVFYMTRLLERYKVPGMASRRQHIEKYDLLQEALGDWNDLVQLESILPDKPEYGGLKDSIMGDRELLELAAYGLLQEL